MDELLMSMCFSMDFLKRPTTGASQLHQYTITQFQMSAY